MYNVISMSEEKKITKEKKYKDGKKLEAEWIYKPSQDDILELWGLEEGHTIHFEEEDIHYSLKDSGNKTFESWVENAWENLIDYIENIQTDVKVE